MIQDVDIFAVKKYWHNIKNCHRLNFTGLLDTFVDFDLECKGDLAQKYSKRLV